MAKNNGSFFSDETIEKIREKAKLRQLTSENREKVSQTLKGRKVHLNSVYIRTSEMRERISKEKKELFATTHFIWIKNIVQNKSFRINETELEKYLNEGFERGRIFKK